MKIICYIILTVLIIGCATKGPDLIQQDFETVVYNDGITLEEAIIIAKKTVRDRTYPETYDIDQPKVVSEFENVPHNEKYWFISFNEVEKSKSPGVFMVALNKESGKIVFFRSYNPENEWVLQAAFLKLYEKEKVIQIVD